MAEKNLFDNTEIAFSLKSDSELERAFFLFKMISKEPLVRIGTAVTKFALNANLPVEGLIRSTVFDHFCGGVSEEDCMNTVRQLADAGVVSVLDYSVEGKQTEEQFDRTLNKVIELSYLAKEDPAMPFAVFKPTGLGRFAVWEKKSSNAELSDSESREWERIVQRYHEICNVAKECGISLLIDAEESWMQNAADDLCEQMMETYNRDRVVVFNTLQCYRWDRLDYLKQIHQRSIERGFKVGFKIVRGAYMEKENERAQEMGYPTPICKDKAQTDQEFNTVLQYLIEQIPDSGVFLGTHNEASCYLAMDLMKSGGMKPGESRIWFGQLYGMSDHISYNLAKQGYKVAKYIPFGPVKDVMPYLIRRAEENTSVAGQTNRELSLLKRERERRGI